MSIRFRHGAEAIEGGTDITISLTPAEAKAIGLEAGTLADWFDTALWALAILRTDRTVRTGDFYTVINDLDHRLIPRLEGIRDAAIRRHKELGGSVGDLASAMDVPRSTAQTRREAIEKRPAPNLFEDWAVNGGPQNH